jgi:hypothetical protein
MVLQLELIQIIFLALQFFKKPFLCNFLNLRVVLADQSTEELLKHNTEMFFEVFLTNLVVAEEMGDHFSLWKLGKGVSTGTVKRERPSAHVLNLCFLGSLL